MLIADAIPGDRNVIKREAEEILKYKDLITEIQRMWNVKAKVIPLIIGATGTISKYSVNTCTPYKESRKLRDKTAILQTVHLLWKVLM